MNTPPMKMPEKVKIDDQKRPKSSKLKSPEPKETPEILRILERIKQRRREKEKGGERGVGPKMPILDPIWLW